MKPSILILAAALMATPVLLDKALAADPPAAAPRPAGDAKEGLHLFMTIGCYQCHGIQGQGGGKSGPKLAPNPLPRAAILLQLRSPRNRMPVYTPVVLSDTQADDIVAYLRSIPPGRRSSSIPLLSAP